MFFEAARKTSTPKYSQGYTYFGLPKAGEPVTHENALKYSAIWACTKIISETIATLPWHVMETKTKIAEHPLDNILYRRPNSEMDAYSLKELIASNAVTWGNHYSEIERNRLGEVVNLWPIDPSRVNPARDSNGRLYYEVDNGSGQKASINAADMFHVRGPSRDGINGYSVIKYAQESISLGMAAESFGATFFGNGAIPGLVIKNTQNAEISAEGVTNLLKTWNKRNKGAGNANKVEYLDAGMEVEKIGIPPEDAQFIETRKFQILEIARWFRVPPHKLAELERSTFSNIESQNIEFVTDAIMPWVTRMESQVNYSLISLEDAEQYYNKLNLMSLMRGDSKARAEYYQIMSGLGVLSIDEIRDKEDYDIIGGAVGDLRLVPMNMTTAERMASGDGLKAAGNVINETAARFVKMEIKKAESVSSAFDMRDFYVDHARKMADGFRNAALLVYKGDGIDSILPGFFANYVADSADTLQNAIETGKKEALLRSWSTRKADNLARDLIQKLISEQKR